jgi:hypothetical protein
MIPHSSSISHGSIPHLERELGNCFKKTDAVVGNLKSVDEALRLAVGVWGRLEREGKVSPEGATAFRTATLALMSNRDGLVAPFIAQETVMKLVPLVYEFRFEERIGLLKSMTREGLYEFAESTIFGLDQRGMYGLAGGLGALRRQTLRDAVAVDGIGDTFFLNFAKAEQVLVGGLTVEDLVGFSNTEKNATRSVPLQNSYSIKDIQALLATTDGWGTLLSVCEECLRLLSPFPFAQKTARIPPLVLKLKSHIYALQAGDAVVDRRVLTHINQSVELIEKLYQRDLRP